MKTIDLITTKTYSRASCAVFFRTRKQWGELANPHNDFPLALRDEKILSTEHLYQALRFPDHPDVQRIVMGTTGAIPAKRKAYEHISLTTKQWVDGGMNVRAMKVVTALKLAQYPDTILPILAASDGRDIVEQSSHDDFWGARTLDGTEKGEQLSGVNVLGQIWMSHRCAIESGQLPAKHLEQQDTTGLMLYGEPLSSFLHAVETQDVQRALI